MFAAPFWIADSSCAREEWSIPRCWNLEDAHRISQPGLSTSDRSAGSYLLLCSSRDNFLVLYLVLHEDSRSRCTVDFQQSLMILISEFQISISRVRTSFLAQFERSRRKLGYNSWLDLYIDAWKLSKTENVQKQKSCFQVSAWLPHDHCSDYQI